jgi:gas vesicle protein
MSSSDDKNALIYLLAGFGLGALLGALAGLLFAPKKGDEIRGELQAKLKELNEKSKEWIDEQKAKRQHSAASGELEAADEVGA